MRIGLTRGNQLLVAPVHMQYVTGFSRTGFSKEPAMNGTSGFQADCEKLCRARLAGKARHARKTQSEVQSSKFRKLSTQNPALRTADRFLHEQRPRFGTGAWHLLRTKELPRMAAQIRRINRRLPSSHHLTTHSTNISINRERPLSAFRVPGRQ